ncbi:putative cytosolic oligopeptidase A-like Protein [Tribolium castaneum]|uniref:Putative cytosolic oligopeptidase A-like Protein n=1 Tax=Tribolium castaneum TaxID=7070 RepID=D6WGE0_TRICA|nr:putative cytosolic oligopeptidase A-like Protein [Tribolium castaneum]
MALTLLGKRILSRRPQLLNSIRKNGYIVLVPEIGEDLPEKNPLLQNDGLPEFSNITIENCMAAIAKQTLDLEAGVKEIETSLSETGTTDIFHDVFQVLEEIVAPLDLTWGLSKTLYLGNSSLMPTKSYLAIHDRAKRARAAKFNSPVIYESVKRELQGEAPHSEEETRILNKFALEGKLNGLELTDSQKVQLKQHINKLTAERLQFKQKVDICTKQFSHTIRDSSIVRDFPLDLLKTTASNPLKPLDGPWKVTLDPHVYLPIMEHCPEREIRWNVWQALVSRGSGYGDRDLSTGVHLEEIRFARRDLAKLLGFETYADLSMETKMAENVGNVNSMLHTLLEKAKPAQETELASLYEFALERGFKGGRIELWDVPYWRKKQLKTLFNYNEEEFKNYFPLPTVLTGLFELCERLFNVVIKQRNDISTWHKDVKFYDIFEPQTSAPIAGFYLDPYARSDEKITIQQSNGWMVGIQSQSKITATKPLAALIFNFEPPSGNKQSHLTFKEVKHLFHKFGLALQHLLTRTTYSEVSGSSNIEWDAVEVSGHVLAHWLYNKEIMQNISCHCHSREKLPESMFDCLMEAHKHLAGIDLSRELYLAALDLELHHSTEYWLEIVKKLWPQFRCFPLDKLDSHPCSFTQIFTEEWAAAYYSHVWSRMIAADVYSAFHEVQGDDQKIRDVGKRYRETFLALGGSCHPSKVFRKFRGRDPSPNALLRGFKGGRIELWDVPYWRKKQLKTLFDYNEEEFKNYFPLPTVLTGLFELCERLFNVVIKQRNDISTWHKDVKFYDIFEPQTSAPIAGFYLDPYARSDEKITIQQSNGWMVGIQSQSKITATKPLAALIFNFEPPSGNKQSHLTFKEVKHLFHKFGLALQHLLTRTTYSEVSGSSNIEWDAVEVSGHVLAHWLYNKEIMQNISCHCHSREKLPESMFDCLMEAHKHLAGIDLSRELYLAALDLELHHSTEYWLEIVKKLWPQFRCFPLDKLDSHPCSFTQIFTEEWAAAYYSHVWSRMIAADVYSAFHEVQGDDQKIRDVVAILVKFLGSLEDGIRRRMRCLGR